MSFFIVVYWNLLRSSCWTAARLGPVGWGSKRWKGRSERAWKKKKCSFGPRSSGPWALTHQCVSDKIWFSIKISTTMGALSWERCMDGFSYLYCRVDVPSDEITRRPEIVYDIPFIRWQSKFKFRFSFYSSPFSLERFFSSTWILTKWIIQFIQDFFFSVCD